MDFNQSLIEFKSLMIKTDSLLNEDAKLRPDYYKTRLGKLLEEDVFETVRKAAVGTIFENKITLVSKTAFPDILVGDCFGIEVKSVTSNQWISKGNSILETTRNADTKYIYLTFGKLNNPVQFLSRPYEDCLYEIAVTHHPRYLINMKLKSGETIFDKIGISYDELRELTNPISPIANYYKQKLKPGESLWWTGDNYDSVVPATLKLFSSLSIEEKEKFVSYGYALFPETMKPKSLTKYNRYALYLTSNFGIVNTNIRDCFSAGGKVELEDMEHELLTLPALFGRVKLYKDKIKEIILKESEETLKEYWGVDAIEENRLMQWCSIVSKLAKLDIGYDKTLSVLFKIFN